MAKKKCKGGVCSLIGRPKAHVRGPIAQARTAGMQGLTQQLQPQYTNPTAALPQAQQPSGNVNLPGFPPNVFHTPQAAAQVLANQQAQPSFAGPTAGMQQSNPLSALPSSQDPNQTIQALQQQIQQLQQQLQGRQQGPLAGLVGLGQPQYQQFQQAGFNSQFPQMNAQNTAIPQGQVLHQSGKQRGAIGKFFAGSRPQTFNLSRFTPYQQEALNFLLQSGLEGLSNQEQFDFNPIANQQLEQFYTQTIPSLAERFTAMGNGQRSSAFQGALGNAGRFLGNDLAAQRAQFGLQQQGLNQSLLQNLVGLGLSPQFETAINPGNGGLIPGLVNAGAQVAKAFI